MINSNNYKSVINNSQWYLDTRIFKYMGIFIKWALTPS